MKKLLAMLLALTMVLSLAACGGGDDPAPTAAPTEGGSDATEAPAANEPVIDVVEGNFTMHSYSAALGTNWNSHAWDTNADQLINTYLTAPLCTMSIEDSINGVYQWIWVAATGIEDVTADHQDDLTKYNVTLPEGKTAEDMEDGYVFEIKLNPDMKWEDGTPINADSYIYSMKALLDPTMRNYRANLYYDGESAVAGGNAYYNSGSPIYAPMVAPYGEGEEPDYSFDLEKGIKDGTVYVSMTSTGMTLYNESLGALNAMGLGMDDVVAELSDAANAYGYTKVTAENVEKVKSLIVSALANLFGITDPAEQENYIMEALFVNNGEVAPVADYDATVGCYKVDDYTIRYVTEAKIDYYYFLTSCISNWLVYEDLYEAGKDTSGELVTTNYCTSIDTTMSFGPYKLESLQEAKQIVFTQNENYYAYQKTDSGYLYSVTDYLVDGEQVQQYQTNKIIIDVMDNDAAKQAFLKGELTEWTPTPDDLPNFATSDQLYKVDETYTLSFFFNTNLDALKKMDASMGNKNSVVLSNDNFRKAMSFGIDRDEFVGATSGYKPAYALLNTLYFYDVYNDPTSSYRNSEPAMQAICNLYGVEYGDGTPYATLQDAYKSINGYNLTEAQKLMKTACDELVAEGLYKAGDDIVIRIGYTAGAMSSANNQQVALMNKFINAAAEGSGFGKITLEGIGNIANRYDAVPAGEYAVGYGAWGGAAFYPFRNMQVYCDPDQYGVNEMGCWDPRNTNLTLTVNGEEMTKTWQEWSTCMVGSGDLAGQPNEVKLEILAAMEEEYLKMYYRIPIASSTSCSMLSYQANYYTDEYNIMYGFGGTELMTYNYTDEEWADFVAEQGGTLNYE